jgi:hypothetical protein
MCLVQEKAKSGTRKIKETCHAPTDTLYSCFKAFPKWLISWMYASRLKQYWTHYHWDWERHQNYGHWSHFQTWWLRFAPTYTGRCSNAGEGNIMPDYSCDKGPSIIYQYICSLSLSRKAFILIMRSLDMRFSSLLWLKLTATFACPFRMVTWLMLSTSEVDADQQLCTGKHCKSWQRQAKVNEIATC